jgi:bacterial/archaeal transporter family-2 protein
MTRSIALLCTAAAGLLVGLQPGSNAALSEHVGDLGAAFVSLAIGVVIIGVLLVVTGHAGRLTGLTGIRPVNLIGGLGGAAVVAIGLAAVRPLGAGAVIAVLVAGQVVMSIVADRLGWFGLHEVQIGIGRLVGVALIIAGTVFVTRS